MSMATFAEIAPLAALLFFFTVFLWIGFNTYRPSMRKTMQEHAFIPLKEEQE